MGAKKEIRKHVHAGFSHGFSKEQVKLGLSPNFHQKDVAPVLKDYADPEVASRFAHLNKTLISILVAIVIVNSLGIIVFGESSDADYMVRGVFVAIALFIPLLLISYTKNYRAIGYISAFILGSLSLPGIFNALSSAPGLIPVFEFIKIVLTFATIFFSLFLLKKIHPEYHLSFSEDNR